MMRSMSLSSTHDIMFATCSTLHQVKLLLHISRQLERFDQVYQKCNSRRMTIVDTLDSTSTSSAREPTALWMHGIQSLRSFERLWAQHTPVHTHTHTRTSAAASLCAGPHADAAHPRSGATAQTHGTAGTAHPSPWHCRHAGCQAYGPSALHLEGLRVWL